MYALICACINIYVLICVYFRINIHMEFCSKLSNTCNV